MGNCFSKNLLNNQCMVTHAMNNRKGGDHCRGSCDSAAADTAVNNNNRSNNSEHNDSISGNIPPLKETTTGKTDSTTVRSKRIIGVKSGKKEEKVDAYCRHPAPTSQVNEYENISPTPSTDL